MTTPYEDWRRQQIRRGRRDAMLARFGGAMSALLVWGCMAFAMWIILGAVFS